MIEVYAAIAIALFGAGGIIGGLVIIAVGIRLDGKRRSLTISDPGRIAVGTRAWCGVRTTPHITADYPSQTGPSIPRQRASSAAGRGPVV